MKGTKLDFSSPMEVGYSQSKTPVQGPPEAKYASKGKRLLMDDDVPSTQIIGQPDWLKRQALIKTRRLTSATRISSPLYFDPIKAYVESMMSCIKYCNEYSLSFIGHEDNIRCSGALVHRHAGYEKTNSGGVTVKNFRGVWAGAKYSELTDAEEYTPYVVTPQTDQIQTVYSPWNARFFESMSMKYGVELPRLAQPTSDIVRPVSDMVTDANTATPHDSQKSPYFKYTEKALGTLTYQVPYNNEKIGDTATSNILPFDNPNGSCRQRHKSGGIEMNFQNISEWPQTVDIVQYKCKKNAQGQFEFVDNPNGNLGQQFIYDPVTNIVANKTQSFLQWKDNAKAGQSEVGSVTLTANTNMQDNENVHTSPTWKFLATYGGDTKAHNQSAFGWVSNAAANAPANYREVERKRVVIPASGSYIFKSEFGGMDYNIIDRVNRQFWQEGTNFVNVPVMVSDIPGETIVTFISVAGLQQPAQFTDSTLRSFDCTGTPKAQVLVKVREYEEIYPWIEIPVKVKPTYTRSYERLPPTAVIQRVVPSTQWVKSFT